MSVLPQAPEATGVAEYIVLAETVTQIGIDPTGPEDPLVPIASAVEALPVLVATRVPPTASAVSATSSGSTRPPIQKGVGIPVCSSTSSSSSSRPLIPDPAAYAGGPTSLVDVDASRHPKRRKLIHQASMRVSGRVAADHALIDSLSNELDATMRDLQDSNVALDNCQRSKREI